MLITKKQWFEKHHVVKGQTNYIQTDLVTQWCFFLIPIYTCRLAFKWNL